MMTDGVKAWKRGIDEERDCRRRWNGARQWSPREARRVANVATSRHTPASSRGTLNTLTSTGEVHSQSWYWVAMRHAAALERMGKLREAQLAYAEASKISPFRAL